MTRTLVATIGLIAVLAFSSRDAFTQPTKKKAATQADIDRLEKKIADQQRVLEKLVRLQQQYLVQMMGLIPDTGTATPTQPPVVAEPEPKPANPEARLEKAIAKAEAKNEAKTEPKLEARPAAIKVEPKKTAKGVGTIVGKVKGGSGDVFVYVEDIVASTSGAATMKQEGKQFLPTVMAVQKGTRVEFPNRDAVFHNVFSVTPDNSFDLGSYRQGETKSVTLTRPGVVNVYCNMHPNMVGHILVVPSSHYVRAGQDGFYRLPNVPSGKHRLVAWAPNAKPVVSEVDVADDEVVTIELEVKKGRATPHTNKDGMPYGSYKD